MFCIFTSALKWMLLPGLLLPTTRHSGKRFSGQKKKKKKSEKSAFIFNVILSKLEIQIQNFNCATVKHYFLFSYSRICVFIYFFLNFIFKLFSFFLDLRSLFMFYDFYVTNRHSIQPVFCFFHLILYCKYCFFLHEHSHYYFGIPSLSHIIYISHIIYTVLLLKANLMAGFLFHFL